MIHEHHITALLLCSKIGLIEKPSMLFFLGMNVKILDWLHREGENINTSVPSMFLLGSTLLQPNGIIPK